MMFHFDMSYPQDYDEMGERGPYLADKNLEKLKWPSQKTIQWFDKHFPKLPEVIEEVKIRKPRKPNAAWSIKSPRQMSGGAVRDEPIETLDEAIVGIVPVVSDDDTLDLI